MRDQRLRVSRIAGVPDRPGIRGAEGDDIVENAGSGQDRCRGGADGHRIGSSGRHTSDRCRDQQHASRAKHTAGNTTCAHARNPSGGELTRALARA